MCRSCFIKLQFISAYCTRHWEGKNTKEAEEMSPWFSKPYETSYKIRIMNLNQLENKYHHIIKHWFIKNTMNVTTQITDDDFQSTELLKADMLSQEQEMCH